MPTTASSAPTNRFQPRFSTSSNAATNANHPDRDQPQPDQQRDELDALNRVADEQDADDCGQRSDQGHHPAALGAVQERGSQLEDAVEEQEDADDHGQRGEAVPGLEQERHPDDQAEQADQRE